MMKHTAFGLLCLLVTAGCSGGSTSLTKDPAVPTAPGQEAASEADVPKGDSYYALVSTSKGDFIVAVHPGWAPLGAARFKELVEAGYYNECRFFRVIEGFMAQIGINGDPALNVRWREDAIADEPVLVSNKRGRVTFAMGGPNSRTTQIFFNYNDANARLDDMGFPPFGEVIQGMEVVDSLYNKYGEGAPQGRGPDQGRTQDEGNAYLNSQFPELDYIKTIQLFDTQEAAKAATGAGAGEPAASSDGAAAPATETPASEAPAGVSPAAETPADGTANP